MKKIKTIIGLALVLLLMIFAVQNASTVEVNFLLWTISMPRALLIALLLICGMALTWIWMSVAALRENLEP